MKTDRQSVKWLRDIFKWRIPELTEILTQLLLHQELNEKLLKWLNTRKCIKVYHVFNMPSDTWAVKTISLFLCALLFFHTGGLCTFSPSTREKAHWACLRPPHKMRWIMMITGSGGFQHLLTIIKMSASHDKAHFSQTALRSKSKWRIQ